MYEYRLTWSSSSSGAFDLKEAYRLARLLGIDDEASPFEGEWIWKTPTIPKIKCFPWQCHHNSIPVRAILASQSMDILPSYPLCNKALETILHVLRDYPFAQGFWKYFPPPLQDSLFYGTGVANWMRLNCCSTYCTFSSGITWGDIFPFGL